MSILKRLFAEDVVGSLLRRPSADAAAMEQPTVEPARPDRIARRPAPATVGLKAVLLNWNAGENDPFSVVNQTLRHYFHACGKNVAIVEISREDWPHRVAELGREGVEFAFTWQGLGSAVTVGDGSESLWDHLRIPLICMHGDHPSHMPANHRLDSRYGVHLYTNAEFARYSNRHFRRSRSAVVIDIPRLHLEARLAKREGEHFAIAKNLDDPIETEKRWSEECGKVVYDAYMRAAEALRARLTAEPYVECHDVLDELVECENLDMLRAAVDLEAHHQFHRELDLYIHSWKTLAVVTSLREIPLRIYGRGWDRIARSAPAGHTFLAGLKMANSQPLYYSRFGLIDVSPAKGLHDRTRRAMANGTGFLSSANLEDAFHDFERYAPLFFGFQPHDLPSKCASVMRDPDAHAERAQRFADRYHDKFHFTGFVSRIDQLAKLASTS